MFAMADASNAVYGLVMAHDSLMFGINLASAASCIAVAGVAFAKQRGAAIRHRAAVAPARPIARPYRGVATVFE